MSIKTVKASTLESRFDDPNSDSSVCLRIKGLTQFSTDPDLFSLAGVSYSQVDREKLAGALDLNEHDTVDMQIMEQVLEAFHRAVFARELAKRIELA